MSKQLSILKAAGIVLDEKRGNQVFYSLRLPCILKFFDSVGAVMKSLAREEREALSARQPFLVRGVFREMGAAAHRRSLHRGGPSLLSELHF